MPYNSAADSGDLEKLQQAFAEISNAFGSVESILAAFGLLDMPVAQRYGILFGCVVFTGTVATVLALLVFGGSFERIQEQAQTGSATIPTDYKARLDRPLLLERLLDARTRLMLNYPNTFSLRKQGQTNLTKMLLNLAPPASGSKPTPTSEAYTKNYVIAYRKCQDKPGGAMLSGRPEARFEAYARAFAGCGDFVNLSYRRSYARMYEQICCDSHKSDDKYGDMYKKDPTVLIGKYIWLEGLNVEKHLEKVFAATSGDMYYYKKSYDSSEVWGFLPDGPFQSKEGLQKSFVFSHLENEAGFCIFDSITERILGVVLLSKDDPANLSIQLDAPILGPSNFESKEQLEACFLLMDRLFANGYRRIQLSIDAKDSHGSKLADRLGFTFEGCILKDQVIKDASRDSNVYGMLNSDWDKGAKMALQRKLYGMAFAQADAAFNKKEEELDEQNRVLAERKAAESAEKKE